MILTCKKGTCSPGTSYNWRIRDITPEENSRWSPWQCLVLQIEFHDLRFGLHSVGSDQRGVIQKEPMMPLPRLCNIGVTYIGVLPDVWLQRVGCNCLSRSPGATFCSHFILFCFLFSLLLLRW
jgi:hypothetical protein